MPTSMPVASVLSASSQKEKVLCHKDDDELVFEDESTILPVTITIGTNKHQQTVTGKTGNQEAGGSSDDASLHFSDVDSDHDVDSSAPPVWGPAGTPDSSHGASGLFAVSDPGVSGVDKGLEMTSWCSRSQDVAAYPPQLLNPAFEGSGNFKPPQESVRSGSTSNGNQSPRTLTSFDNAATPTNHEQLPAAQPFPPQNTHNVPYTTTGGSSPPLPAVNIYHLQQQQYQHNRSHHYDPNHATIQNITYPYNTAPNGGGGGINSPPQMYIPAIHQSPVTAAHLPPPTATSTNKQRPITPGTSLGGDNNASMHVLASSANSLGASGRGGEWSSHRVTSADHRGGPTSYDRNVETPSMYPSLYNNAASSFIANSSQNNQRVHSANRGEWSFSKRSDVGNGNAPNMLQSPHGDRSQSLVSAFAVHGSEAHFTTHQSFNTGSAVIGGYGSTFLPTGGGVHIGGATTPDVTAPLPQFGAVMSHPYSTYPTSPLSAQQTINPQSNRTYGSQPNNNDHQQYQQHPSAYTYSRERPVSVENWAAMSTPSHSNSVSLKRDSYPQNGGPITPRSARGSHQSGGSVSPSMGPLPSSRPPKVVMTEDGSSPTVVESGSTAVGEADTSVSKDKEEQPAPTPTTEVVKVCRHYLEGKCNRRKCRFLHPEGLAGSEAPTQ